MHVPGGRVRAPPPGSMMAQDRDCGSGHPGKIGSLLESRYSDSLAIPGGPAARRYATVEAARRRAWSCPLLSCWRPVADDERVFTPSADGSVANGAADGKALMPPRGALVYQYPLPALGSLALVRLSTRFEPAPRAYRRGPGPVL